MRNKNHQRDLEILYPTYEKIHYLLTDLHTNIVGKAGHNKKMLLAQFCKIKNTKRIWKINLKTMILMKVVRRLQKNLVKESSLRKNKMKVNSLQKNRKAKISPPVRRKHMLNMLVRERKFIKNKILNLRWMMKELKHLTAILRISLLISNEQIMRIS